jgi:hypothetical protein
MSVSGPRFLTEKDGGPDLGGFWGRGEIGACSRLGTESGPDFTPLPISTTLIVSNAALQSVAAIASDGSLYQSRGIGIPNIRLRFLRFVVFFRLVFLALRFFAI